MAAFEKLIDALRAHGDNVTENGDKARAHCPAHNGHPTTRWRSDTRDDGKGIILHCHAGCDLHRRGRRPRPRHGRPVR